MELNNVKFKKNNSVYIIAEIGANHDGNKEKAKETIYQAYLAGVDAVKFQTYSSEELLSDEDRIIEWKWEGGVVKERIGDMFDRISLKREDHFEVFDYAKKLGLDVFSTPFSLSGVKFLAEELKVPYFKVASSDVNYLDMLIEMSNYDIPVILSIGKSTLAEADIAINTLVDSGCKEIVIMHCVAQYPSPMEEMNLNVIKSLKTLYPDNIIGFSDHSLGITASLGAVALGARVIEKHFTLDNGLKGPDHWFSMNPESMSSLVNEIRNMEKALGNSRKIVVDSELEEKKTSTRSISLSRDIKKGEKICMDDIKIVRPGWGISPYDKEKILGLRINKNLSKNTVLEWRYFK